MGRLIEQQAVIDCLTNTAKYYDMPQADEWTKGIHYGLLHGVDNILDNVPTVEAIPKANVYKAIQEMMKYEHEGFINISLARLDEILKKCGVSEDGLNEKTSD